MKLKWLIPRLTGALLAAGAAHAEKEILFVGGYTQGVGDGILVYEFDPAKGKLTDLKTPARGNSPTFLAVSSNQKLLYAACEGTDLGKSSVDILAFQIGQNGALRPLNQQATGGSNACHVALSPDGKWLAAANYTDGNVSLFQLAADGTLVARPQQLQSHGRGLLEERQASAHAHSARFDATSEQLWVADLGLDQLRLYHRRADGISWLENKPPAVPLPPGSGPRHFVLTADERFLYLINELSSTVTVLQKTDAAWLPLQTLSTLPAEFRGENSAADIHLALDERFVYASNRGHDSLMVFHRNPSDGTLKPVQTISVEGRWPRNFTLDPSGDFLLVANQHSNDITIFRIDPATGILHFTGSKMPTPAPACLQFLRKPENQ